MNSSHQKAHWDVFISYARKDDEPFVEKLRDDLTAAGKTVWWDRKAMESRGRSFLLEIRDAIWNCERVIAVIGPQALQSDYVWYEWNYAYHLAKALVPILRKGDFESITAASKKLLWRDEFERSADKLSSTTLAQLHCTEFTGNTEAEYQQAFNQLLRILNTDLLPLASIYPPTLSFPPANYLPRPQIIDRLAQMSGVEARDVRAVQLENRVLVLQGRGGLGKSVIANAFAHAITTRWAFTDGIIWLDIGRKANKENLRNRFKEIGEALNQDTAHYLELEIAQQQVAELLKDNKCLLVLDDVWYSNHAQLFRSVLGTGCVLLITTRDKSISKSMDAQLLSLEEYPLEMEQALQLLADWSGQNREGLPAEAQEVAGICGRVPLALSICGALVDLGESSWSSLPRQLKTAKQEVLETHLEDYSSENIDVFTPIKVSLAFLKKLDQEDGQAKHRYDNYLDLAALPESDRTPDAVVSTLWIVRRTIDSDLSMKLLGRFGGRALLQLFGTHPYADILLHSLHHTYIRSLINETDWIRLHAQFGKGLLKTWQSGSMGDEAKLDKRQGQEIEKYCINYLFYHLKEGRCWKELMVLLGDVKYLKSKQDKEAQHGLETEIIELIHNEQAPTTEILRGALEGISNNLPLSIEQADWLDIFAYWLNTYGIEQGQWRSPALHDLAIAFDTVCGKVSEQLTNKFILEGKPDYALRFAELRSWVYQRAGDFSKCEQACHDAELRCAAEDMAKGYQTLARVEFIRMRANALTRLAQQTVNADTKVDIEREAEQLYQYLSSEFARIGKENWYLSNDEWRQLEQDTSAGFQLKHKKGIGDAHSPRAVVVSNAHDAISALYVIQLLQSHGVYVEWIHHKEFNAEHPALQDCRLAILIGGPKSPGISDVAQHFYDADKQGYLRMYSGLYFGPEMLKATIDGVQFYMVGGVSKAHTLLAAYQLTDEEELRRAGLVSTQLG